MLERFGTLLFWRNVERNWNGTSSNSKVDGTERNKFQFIAGWNGTERVPKKSERSAPLTISHSMTSQTNCSEHRMICSRFLSDYLEIFSAPPRKSLDNHSKTSHRSSCFPHSFFEVVEYENYY